VQSATAADPLPILVVDDDSALIRTLADILRLHGYSPATAGTGREGLMLAANQEPALAVVDLRLPDMDGMELAARLHELSQLTEVVVLTGNASVESAVAALREHSVDYLVKPVNVDQLLQVASLATERWQRRHAEVRLRESDERFRRVVDSNMLGILFWETNGVVLDANDAFLATVGYTRDALEAGAINLSQLTPPEYHALDQAKLSEIDARGVSEPYEKEFIRADGSRVPILIGAATLQGRADQGVCFVLDITARKEAERAVEARASQQAAVARLGQRALSVADLQSLFDDAIAFVAETLDLPVAAVFERRSDGSALVMCSGVGWYEARPGQAVVAADADTQWGLTITTSEPVIVDAARPARASRPLSPLEADVASGVTVVIPGPVNPYGVLAAHDRRPRTFTVDDVHFLQAMAHILGTAVERNRRDGVFRQAQRLEAVGRLASGVAHDFNNMLSAISGFGQLVQAGLGAKDPLQEDVGEILKAAERAAGLTRQLLTFSREQQRQPTTVCVNDVVTDMKNMVQRLIGDRIELILSLDPHLGLIKVDPNQIEQVILNLCVNARDAMPAGGRLTIETTNTELDSTQTHEHSIDAPGTYVRLCVTDTGMGMDRETQAQIFEPFFTTKAPDKGTGLGLATVYGIVKQSDGEIWVYSERNVGTTFKLFFPRRDDEPLPESESAEAWEPARHAATVLVVDDEPAILSVLRRMLEGAGYVVIAAPNGTEAVTLGNSRREPIDLIVTDVTMPGLNGPDVVAELRKRWPGARALYLSGYTDQTVIRERMVEEGANFLEKPFALDSFIRKVREVLDRPARAS
jgi:PAS domain S-box-containing protein